MTRADKLATLARVAAERHHTTRSRAEQAIAELGRSGAPVTFIAVAEAARVSRAWLYREPEVRSRIIALRSAMSHSATVPSAQRASTESIRARLQASDAEVTRLRAENALLRTQLAQQLGRQRAGRGEIQATESPGAEEP